MIVLLLLLLVVVVVGSGTVHGWRRHCGRAGELGGRGGAGAGTGRVAIDRVSSGRAVVGIAAGGAGGPRIWKGIRHDGISGRGLDAAAAVGPHGAWCSPRRGVDTGQPIAI